MRCTNVSADPLTLQKKDDKKAPPKKDDKKTPPKKDDKKTPLSPDERDEKKPVCGAGCCGARMSRLTRERCRRRTTRRLRPRGL